MSALRQRDLVLRGLAHYWRTHAAVVLGVATAVAVLAGALLVGDSVRGSLRDLVLDRLGRADLVVVSENFFREQLAADVAAQPAFAEAFTGISPLIIVQGLVTEQASGRRAGQVLVYGVDERFWRFHGVGGIDGPSGRDALVSPALAAQIGAEAGGALLVRVQRPSDVPLESLHGRRDDLGSAVRLTVRAVLPPASLGEFSLAPQQGEVRAVFMPLSVLQEELERPARVNALLVAAPPGVSALPDRVARLDQLVGGQAALEDVGLHVETLDGPGVLDVWSDAGLLDDADVTAIEAARAGTALQDQPVFTYLVNGMRVGEREVPYSLVTAIDLTVIAPRVALNGLPGVAPPVVLNEWAAADLGAAPGDALTLEYFVWEEPGRLVTRSAEFQVAGIVPVEAGDPDLAPAYPGISETDSLIDWDPPFAIDLGRIRPVDEELLGSLSDHAQGVRTVRGGAAALAVALRCADLGPSCTARRTAAR